MMSQLRLIPFRMRHPTPAQNLGGSPKSLPNVASSPSPAWPLPCLNLPKIPPPLLLVGVPPPEPVPPPLPPSRASSVPVVAAVAPDLCVATVSRLSRFFGENTLPARSRMREMPNGAEDGCAGDAATGRSIGLNSRRRRECSDISDRRDCIRATATPCSSTLKPNPREASLRSPVDTARCQRGAT
jgi:hypothetical protein